MTTKGKPVSIVPQLICGIMLLWALNPGNPYGYYVLLRIVLCAACAYIAMRAAEIGKTNWTWILGVTAVIYNPLIRIHLTRQLWSVINVATILLLIATFWSLRKPESQTEGEKKQ